MPTAVQPSRKWKLDPNAPKFTPPSVEFGEEVFWYPFAAKSNTPEVARVREVFNEQVSLLVITPSGVKHKYSVRHVDDPRAKDPRIVANGGWDKMPPKGGSEAAAEALKASVEALKTEVAKLTSRIDGLEKRVAKS